MGPHCLCESGRTRLPEPLHVLELEEATHAYIIRGFGDVVQSLRFPGVEQFLRQPLVPRRARHMRVRRVFPATGSEREHVTRGTTQVPHATKKGREDVHTSFCREGS